MQWTEEKIRALSSEDYRKYRKEIKKFYNNIRFRQDLIIRQNKNQHKADVMTKNTTKETLANDYYFEHHKELKYLQKLKNYPWRAFLQAARSRCECKSNVSYIDYGFLGIQCLLTEQEIKKLWFRDKAYEMKQPSLDRKDALFHYTYNNCQFIEFTENVKRAKKFQKINHFRKTLDINGGLDTIRKVKKC
ncbi:MAG: hypothetical protein ACTSYZ_12625 [Candidatus Helarchaeota archaeon]